MFLTTQRPAHMFCTIRILACLNAPFSSEAKDSNSRFMQNVPFLAIVSEKTEQVPGLNLCIMVP